MEKIRYELSGKATRFKQTWQPFLDYISKQRGPPWNLKDFYILYIYIMYIIYRSNSHKITLHTHTHTHYDHLSNIVLVPFAAQTALTLWGMDSTEPWRCAVVSGSKMSAADPLKSCKLRGGTSMDWTCLSSTSNRCSVWLRSGVFGGQVNTSNSLLCSSNHPEPFPAERGHSHQGNCVHERLFMVCNNAEAGGTCQSHIHMDDRTRGFPVEHCPKHHTASASLPSSHNAWCHVSPR